jgi:hypothetical protein
MPRVSSPLALVRSADITCPQLRAILRLSPQARQAITDFIEHTSRLPDESGGREALIRP